MREMVGEYDVPNRAPRISYPFLLSVCFGVITLAGSNAMIKARWEHFSHPADVGVRGIGATREEAFQQEAVEAVVAFARDELGLTLRGVVPSKVKGPKGNQEYLAVFDRPAG